MKEQGRLPDPRITAQEYERTRNDPTPQHPIQFCQTGAHSVECPDIYGGDRCRKPCNRGRGVAMAAMPLGRGALLQQASPLSAVGAATHPSSGLITAALAEVMAQALSHRSTSCTCSRLLKSPSRWPAAGTTPAS